MPSTFKLSTIIQNAFTGSNTRSPIAHTLPAINSSANDYWSIAAEFTGTGSNAIATVAGTPITITVGGTTQIDPITRATIGIGKVHGFMVYVGRAGTAAPTSVVAVTTSSFAGSTITSTALSEGGVCSVHVPAGVTAAGSQTLTINLTGTTGYKVSVIAYGSIPVVV